MTDIRQIIDTLRENGLRLATAESCTGGLLAAAVTDIPGASDVFDCGVVSYSNAIKAQVLSVSTDVLAEVGAVSHQTAQAMAKGVRSLAGADIALSTTGIAGPGGGSKEKPVGLVYIGLADREKSSSTENHFSGSREDVRSQTVAAALQQLENYLADKGLI